MAKKKTRIHSYTVLFEPMMKGGYNVVVPAIPEICTFGETLTEAKMMAKDAIFCYLESLTHRRVPPRDVRRSPHIAKLKIVFEPA